MPTRSLAACFFAEVVGTFLLVLFGCGAVHVAVLTGALEGLWQVGIVWGVSIMLAIYVCGAVSGAHINPAITVGLASWGLFEWRRVPPYVAAQLIGAFVAAALLFALFEPYLAAKERQKGVERGGAGSQLTAMCYGEFFPNPGALAGGEQPYSSADHAAFNELVSEGAACLAEVVGTMILALVVVGVTDRRNPLNPGPLGPVFIGLCVAGLISVIAPLTQACLNPARDYGPRLFAYLAGWGEAALPRGSGLVTVYLASPLAGSVLGVGLYRRLIRPALPPIADD